MAAHRLTPATAQLFRDRLDRLRPDADPAWGRLSATGMLAHVALLLDVSTQQAPGHDGSTWFTRWVVFWAAMCLPLPRGVKVPGRFTPRADGDFDDQRRRLDDAIDRFIVMAQAEPRRTAPHPIFGPLSLKTWTKLHGKHLDHHLRQFGV